jgi:hypothetical protein
MLVVKSVPKAISRKSFLATMSVLVMVATTLFGARVAEADSTWYQSYQRASPEEACVAQPGETPWQDSWGTNPGWAPSWEQWANSGMGGWVCSRNITWARDSAARVYNIGDIGPGGGLVFLISGGLTYEMAPKTWRGSSSDDTPQLKWCDNNTDVPLAVGIAVGTGAANTAAMADPTKGCASSPAATAALAYPGTNGSAGQWFIPSQDELNAMCNYSRNPSAPAAPSISCFGSGGTTQDGLFAAGRYGFTSNNYWSSSQSDANRGRGQDLEYGYQYDFNKPYTLSVRPVRAF